MSAERETLTSYRSESLTKHGETTFDTFEPLQREGDAVVVNLCIDVSEVDLTDATGESVISGDRPPRSGRKVTFVPGDTATKLQIASNHHPSEGFAC